MTQDFQNLIISQLHWNFNYFTSKNVLFVWPPVPCNKLVESTDSFSEKKLEFRQSCEPKGQASETVIKMIGFAFTKSIVYLTKKLFTLSSSQVQRGVIATLSLSNPSPGTLRLD